MSIPGGELMLRGALAMALAWGSLGASPGDDETGFEKVFDGRTFDGVKFFVAKGDPAAVWTIADGVLRCAGKPAGYWYTEKKYKDFTLRFDWKFVRPEGLADDSKFNGNSGYLLWVGDEHKIWPYSLECQGMNKQAGYVYFVGNRSREKNKFEYDDQARAKAVKPVGEWNTYEIIARKGTVVVNINGTKITTVSSHEYTEAGHIAFQSEGAEIHWRNIRVKPE
jgi:3-keto-disaccharide hydrolase